MAVCRTDLAFLIQKAGFSAASVVEAADGVLAAAVGCPEVPPRCCPILPVLKSRRTEGLTLPSQWRWKISAIAAFCACPFFSFPSLRSSPVFFPWALNLGYWLVSCSLSSALSESRGGGGGRVGAE